MALCALCHVAVAKHAGTLEAPDMMEPVGIEEHRALERQEDVDHLMRDAISMHSEAITMHSSDRSMSITRDQPALIRGNHRS